ncbi:DUF397 domain-containing protein [Streptomyces sp. NPDC057307]|uniref:DUF397 domain-containing protein n=1 Tax=Streptomyces sp. NPDC057307 TaxID=3346096 RepID=UPI003642F7B4
MSVHRITDASILTTWRKSSYSGGDNGSCVEVAGALPWRKSSYSGPDNGDCVEVVDGLVGVVPVRDSKNPHGPALVVSGQAWSAFIDGVKSDL